MIEKMLERVRQFLPLKITDANWDGTTFHMHGPAWSFNTLSAWRISSETKVISGCYDADSNALIDSLENLQISSIFVQNNRLKIDPVFLLSNGHQLEIFSTDTFEPWTFNMEGLGFFVASPNAPEAFGQTL